MRLHLPPSLRSALLASLVSFSGFTLTPMPPHRRISGKLPRLAVLIYVDGAGEGDAVDTAGNWEGDAAPSRQENKGPHLILMM